MTSIPYNKFLNNIVKNIDSNNYLNEIKYTGGTKEEDLKKLIKKMKKNFKTIQLITNKNININKKHKIKTPLDGSFAKV